MMKLKEDLQEAVIEYILIEISYPYKREDIDYDLIKAHYDTLAFGVWYKRRATSIFFHTVRKSLEKEERFFKRIVIHLYGIFK